MKTTIYLLLFLFLSNIISAQTITINYDSNNEKFEIKECKNKNKSSCKKGDLVIGDEYNVILTGINTAVIKTTLEVKPFNIDSSIPAIIQPLFPGISSSGQLSFGAGLVSVAVGSLFNDVDVLADKALGYYNVLDEIKEKSNELYRNSKFTIKHGEARTKFTAICTRINSGLTDKEKIKILNKKIIEYQNYISTTKEIMDKKFETTPNPPNSILEKYITIVLMSKVVSSTDFTKYSNFIYNSLTAKNQTDPRNFTVKSDGSDLKIVLENTYVNDTIGKKTFDFYTKGNFSFDFSTGFFYSNEVEQSYFLEGREGDTLKTNILREPKRNFDISFGALGHLSYKFSSRIKGGISMGASLSPIDGKTRYLLGGSLIFGREKQLALNAGISLVKIKVLSDSISQDEIGKYVDASVTSVPTYEKTQSGFYFGVTYNLTAKKKYD
ncbi:hypothetical protein [Aquimarina spinulae]|uniref:hypothetical protein n=1 Tax=Aquimarina spinulae TaxID=1192023 RepID=UPI000D5535C9|nr:hypothetical protein [Aquimarina spinulae]